MRNSKVNFNKQTIKKIENKLGVTFKNKALLELAFTHSSYGNINEIENNERLEFLGDSVLHFVTTKYLYNHFKDAEGVLSKVRSYVVSAKNLSKCIDELGVSEFLHYAKSTKNLSKSIKANLFEAVLASIYLDQGFETAYNFATSKLHYTKELFDKLIKNTNDYKTKLQEVIQEDASNELVYRLVKKEGAPHEPTFTVDVLLNNKAVGRGVAKNKKEAENLAAKKALDKLL